MISKYMERFSTKERVLHWFVTLTFFTLLLSALGLYSRLFTGYFNLPLITGKTCRLADAGCSV